MDNLSDFANFDKCDKAKIWLNNKDEPVHTTAQICRLGLFCFLPVISQSNLQTWVERLLMVQHLGLFTDTIIRPEDLRAHIGLKLEVPHKQTGQWWNDLTQVILKEAQEQAREILPT